WKDEWVQSICFSFASLFYMLFGRSFLNTAKLTPRWDYVLRGLVGLRLLITLAAVVGYFLPSTLRAYTDTATIFWFAVEAVVILIYIFPLARLRYRVAWFFIVGSGLVFLGGFMPVWLTSVFGVLVNNGIFVLVAVSLEVLVFSLGLGYKMRQQQQDKLVAEQALNHELQKVNTAFGRFVPHAFLESLGHQSVLDVQLGDQVEKEVTVLFSDIRRYTTLAEGMTPQENFNFLNAYLGRMGPIIQAHQGFVNQYYGDGIMALFMHEPADALQAATAMQQSLADYNEVRLAKGRLPLQIGIGVHTGPLMMGIIGDTLRLEAGVVSDTVNTASRMEGLTKHFGINLLLSDATFQRLSESDRGQLRLLGRVIVKGRQQPMPVYQAYGGEPEATQMQLDALQAPFEAAMQTYLQADFAGASSQWEAILAQAPEDGPTQHYLRLSREHLLQGVPEDWNGVEVMLVK
ncbi:MAG: adenylate/guanylate cyclase domain-containing protein, partial [Bacteroidota bacterium]